MLPKLTKLPLILTFGWNWYQDIPLAQKSKFQTILPQMLSYMQHAKDKAMYHGL
jgi:hypothetical protein